MSTPLPPVPEDLRDSARIFWMMTEWCNYKCEYCGVQVFLKRSPQNKPQRHAIRQTRSAIRRNRFPPGTRRIQRSREERDARSNQHRSSERSRSLPRRRTLSTAACQLRTARIAHAIRSIVAAGVQVAAIQQFYPRPEVVEHLNRHDAPLSGWHGMFYLPVLKTGDYQIAAHPVTASGRTGELPPFTLRIID